jgi:hypothetical protein
MMLLEEVLMRLSDLLKLSNSLTGMEKSVQPTGNQVIKPLNRIKLRRWNSSQQLSKMVMPQLPPQKPLANIPNLKRQISLFSQYKSSTKVLQEVKNVQMVR